MENYVDRFKTCGTSSNLRARHDALIELISALVPLFNREIGPVGGSAIREILDVQRRFEQLAAHPLQVIVNNFWVKFNIFSHGRKRLF